MKLDWRVENGVLKAAGCAANYEVSLGDHGWHAKADYSMACDPAIGRLWATEYTLADGSGCREHLDWCEKHDDRMLAERPDKCPPQVLEYRRPAPETPGGMSGSVSKFPSTLEAPVWASRCTAWFGSFKVPDLTDWFQAALSHGFREGQASVYELVDRAQRERDIFGPGGAMTANQFRAWQMMNSVPPSPEPATANPGAPLDSFDARTWAKEFVRSAQANPQVLTEECMVGWFANALMRGYDEHRWKTEKLKIDSFEDEHAWSRRLARNYLDDHRLAQIDAEVILAWLAECIRLGYGQGRLDEKTIQGAATEAPKSPSPPAPEKLERLKEYFRTPGTRVNITPEERDAIIDGRGWPDQSPPAPEPPGVEESIENMSWGLKNEAKRSAERDNALDKRLSDLEAKVPPSAASRLERMENWMRGAGFRLAELEMKACT